METVQVRDPGWVKIPAPSLHPHTLCIEPSNTEICAVPLSQLDAVPWVEIALQPSEPKIEKSATIPSGWIRVFLVLRCELIPQVLPSFDLKSN